MKKTYKVLCALGALLIGTMSASAITKTWSETDFKNAISGGVMSITGNHIAIGMAAKTAADGTIAYNNPTVGAARLECGGMKTGEQNFILYWSCNAGSTMKVSKVTINACSVGGATGGRAAYATLGANGKRTDIRYSSTLNFTDVTNTDSADLSIDTINIKHERIKFDDSHPLLIKKITLEYSLIPDAPVLGDLKETSVDVTIDEANPNYVDLAGLFSAQDHYGDYLAYECSEENGIIDNGKFYATAAGVYHVKAYVAALKNCHDQSEKSEEEFTITVNRIDPTLEVLKADSAISVTVNEDNIYSVAMLDMLNYVGDGLAFEVIEGEAANLVLADSAVYALMAGDYTIAISSVESARYNASAEAVNIYIHATAAQSQIETVLEESNILVVDSMIENVFVFADTLGMQIIVEPEGVIAYDATANTLTAIAKGEATLTLSQPEIPGVIEAYEAVYTFIVMDDTPTALFNIKHAGKVSKMMNNGKLVIIRDGKVHNALGARIR